MKYYKYKYKLTRNRIDITATPIIILLNFTERVKVTVGKSPHFRAQNTLNAYGTFQLPLTKRLLVCLFAHFCPKIFISSQIRPKLINVGCKIKISKLKSQHEQHPPRV